MPEAAPRAVRIGLISDTHGLLRPQALDVLAGSDYIIHGGDIGNAAILEELARIAPVTAVRGNNDTAAWADGVRETEVLSAGGLDIYVIHDLAQLDLQASAGIKVVISGHSHKPAVSTRDGVLFVNPGSAGPRRFSLPISVGQLSIAAGQAQARLITLQE